MSEQGGARGPAAPLQHPALTLRAATIRQSFCFFFLGVLAHFHCRGLWKEKLMMYKLAVTIYSGLVNLLPPAALVNERRPLDPPLEPDGGQHWRSRPESLYWRGESIEGKNKFTNKQQEDERRACRTAERSLVHQDLINSVSEPQQTHTGISY